jgi:hypothetical protein
MADPKVCAIFTPELMEYLEGGLDILVATRDAALAPECTMAMGVKTHRDRKTLTIYLPRVGADLTLRNLADNGQIAATFCRPIDHRTVQLKGRSVAVRETGPDDREIQQRHRGALVEQLALVGVPRALTRRFRWWPSVAIEVDVTQAFTQTPGPGAGEPLFR